MAETELFKEKNGNALLISTMSGSVHMVFVNQSEAFMQGLFSINAALEIAESIERSAARCGVENPDSRFASRFEDDLK